MLHLDDAFQAIAEVRLALRYGDIAPRFRKLALQRFTCLAFYRELDVQTQSDGGSSLG